MTSDARAPARLEVARAPPVRSAGAVEVLGGPEPNPRSDETAIEEGAPRCPHRQRPAAHRSRRRSARKTPGLLLPTAKSCSGRSTKRPGGSPTTPSSTNSKSSANATTEIASHNSPSRSPTTKRCDDFQHASSSAQTMPASTSGSSTKRLRTSQSRRSDPAPRPRSATTHASHLLARRHHERQSDEHPRSSTRRNPGRGRAEPALLLLLHFRLLSATRRLPRPGL